MPAKKADLHISIKLFDRNFSISGVRLLDGSWKIKRGRSWSEKTPYATSTQIFKSCLAWVTNVCRKQTAGYEIRS